MSSIITKTIILEYEYKNIRKMGSIKQKHSGNCWNIGEKDQVLFLIASIFLIASTFRKFCGGDVYKNSKFKTSFLYPQSKLPL